MNAALPGQVKALTVEVLRDLALRHPGLERCASFKRDVKFFRDGTFQMLTEVMPLEGKYFDSLLARGEESKYAPREPLPRRLFDYWVKGLETHDPSSVLALRQMFSLFSKLQVTAAYGDEPFNKFVARNASVYCPDVDLSLERRIIGMACCGIDLLEILPKHGPGAVAGRERPWEKMRFKKIYKSIDAVYPICDYFFLNYNHLSTCLSDLESFQEEDSPCTRLVAVPKDFRGPRLISAEPKETQWLQQGQARKLMDCIERSPLTRGVVNFSDQEINRQLAMSSSVDGRFVTIDLKDASDRVAIGHVKKLFLESLYRCLNATRSTHTKLPSGEIVELNMFSPMGSAVCFPIESLVFYAISLGAILRAEGYRNLRRSCIRAKKYIRVYGDDLIIATEYSEAVMKRLSEVGFVINDAKTCTGPYFRESCGCDAYKGVDVTPVRVKSLPDRRNPSSLPAATDVINLFGKRHLNTAASLLETYASEVFGNMPYSTIEGTGAILKRSRVECFEHNCSCFKSRRNPDLQRFEFLIPRYVSRTHKSDEPAWSEVFRALTCGPKKDDRYPIPHRGRLTQRWSLL
nr:MAG: RNA dependent RNA polymerase [Leviviridae sp.]